MRFWNRHKKSSPSRRSTLALEKLEDRELLSANTIAIQSGQTVRFVDSDGTRVNVRLVGPGTGTIDLVNGQSTGADIDNLTLTGTTARSQLKITTRGGAITGTTINELVIEKALNELGALNRLVAPKVDFVDGGHFTADGNISQISIRNLRDNAQIDVDGNVGRLKARTLQSAASIDVAGTLQRFVAELLSAGAVVAADKLDFVSVRQSNGATFDVGAGGLHSAKIKNLYDSVISSDGDIGKVVVQGKMNASSFASNINSGSDGVYGTFDDFVTNPSATGNIQSIRVRGKVGTGPGLDSTFVASGTIGKLNFGARNRNAAPFIWEQAATQNIPLNFVSTAINPLFDNDDIWVAVFGQDISIPQPGQNLTGPSYFLDSSNIINGEAQRTLTTSQMVSASTPNLAILPSANLTTWGSALNLPVPLVGRQFTGRILISVGAPVQAQINADGSVAAPSASSPGDPSTGTFYDFLEFTVTNNSGVPNIDIDTSQIDSFGLPIGLEFFQDAAGTQQFTVGFTGTATSGSPIITGISTSSLQMLGIGQVVSGSNIPAGARIQSISLSGNSLKLDMNATPGSNTSFTAYTGGPVGVAAYRDVITSGSTNLALMDFISTQVANGHDQARPFLQTAAPFVSAGPVPITFVEAGSDIKITTSSVAGLANGDKVVISGVQGVTNANNTPSVQNFTIQNVDSMANTFELQGISGTGTYVAGGEWSRAITGASNTGPITITAKNVLQGGELIEVSGVEGNTAANGFYFVSTSNLSSTSFELENSQGNGAYTGGGIWKAYTTGNRLTSPKDVVESIPDPQDSNGLNNYFNEEIDAFFDKYKTGNPAFSIVSDVTGKTYSGNVQTVNIDYTVGETTYFYNGTALHLTSSDPTDTTSYDIIYPFFTTNSPSPDVYTPAFTPAAPPTWITAAGKQTESASQMIFACDAVFADNGARQLSGDPLKVLGDLEDSISAAFNRGIAQNDPSTWGETTFWYPTNGTYNYWVQYWHQTGLAYGDLAYAFPYDDKFGASTNLNENNVGQVKITLGAWTNSTIQSTTTFVTPPTSATLQGPISLTAKVAAADTGMHPLSGTMTFYINGAAINSVDSTASPPAQPIEVDPTTGEASISATLPVMPDGNTPHTYTVRAVYSGDQHRAPSVAHIPLQLTPAFTLGFSAGNVAVGSPVTLDVTLSATTYSGKIDFSISLADGTGMQSLGTATPMSALTSKQVTIPANLLQIAGNVGSGKNSQKQTVGVINNVSNFTGIRIGQTLTGTGLSSDTTVASFTKHQLTLNQPVPQSATGNVTLTINGRTFAAFIPPTEPTNVNGIDRISDLQVGDVVTGIGIPPGTTVGNLISGNIYLNQGATAGTGVTITSNAAGAAFPITVTYKPNDGQKISTSANIGIIAS